MNTGNSLENQIVVLTAFDYFSSMNPVDKELIENQKRISKLTNLTNILLCVVILLLFIIIII